MLVFEDTLLPLARNSGEDSISFRFVSSCFAIILRASDALGAIVISACAVTGVFMFMFIESRRAGKGGGVEVVEVGRGEGTERGGSGGGVGLLLDTGVLSPGLVGATGVRERGVTSSFASGAAGMFIERSDLPDGECDKLGDACVTPTCSCCC